ncbi:hypothetical protein QUF64_04045 [Anaerolineales bacterium HSG6]|nr:hypothetical protein [Anaerolineales bacterium HSG6]
MIDITYPPPNIQVEIASILGKKCRFFYRTDKFVLAFNGQVRCAPRGDFDIEMEDPHGVFFPKLVYPATAVTPPEFSTQDDIYAWVTLKDTDDPHDLIIWG